MASTKIQNLPLKAPIGAMKIPTGGFGDYSITVSSIGDFIIDAFNLATKDYVDTLLVEKEDRIDLTGGYLTPTSQNASVPDTNNDVIDEVAQALLDRIEYVKDNFSAAPAHNELTGRSATGSHPSTSISHKSGTVYSYLQQNESDINNINNVSIPTINQTLSNKQDLIEAGSALTPVAAQSPVPSVSHTGLNSAIQALLNRTEWVKNNNTVKSVNSKTGEIVLTPSDIATIGNNNLNTTPLLTDVPELVDKNGVRDPNANAQAQSLLNNIGYLLNQTIYDNYGIVTADPLKTYVARLPIQAVFKADGSDETDTLEGYFAAAKSLGRHLRLPVGTIIYSRTLVIDFPLILEGSGRDSTILQFKNSTLNKPAIQFVRGGGLSDFSNFTIRDETKHTSIGWKFIDNTTDTGSPLWKCSFRNIVTTAFNVGNLYTASNPLSGGTHAHCSEMLWSNCRFINNKVAVLNQNCQAVNNMYLKVDIENFNASYINGQTITDDNFEFYRDEAGGGITHIGGSLIGKGMLYSWIYQAGGTTLFSGGWFTIDKVKMELRTGHNGVVINEGIHGVSSSLNMKIRATNIECNMFSQNLDFMRFGGRINAHIESIDTVAGTGFLTIRQYPTLGRSANTATGSQGAIDVYKCGRMYYEKETSSPYGTYNADYAARVIFHDQGTSSTSQTFSTDADGWQSLNSGGDIQQFGFRFGTAAPFAKLMVNSDANGLPSDWKVFMPKYGRPFKLFLFKHPSTFASNVGYELYLAKNKALWVDPANFNYITDAFLVAAIPDTTNKAGYFEVNVQLTSNSLGTSLQSGMGSWTEGRIFLRKIGTSNIVGFVGVEYA